MISNSIPPTGAATKVYDVVKTNNTIRIDPSSMQPLTGTYTAYVTDLAGKQLSRSQIAGSSNKTYNPHDPSLNLIYSQVTTDAAGKNVVKSIYQDGTIVTFDEATNNTLGIQPGSDVRVVLGYSNPASQSGIDTRQLLIAGREVPNTAVQTVTNASTGVVTAIGGIATGRIIDSDAATGNAIRREVGVGIIPDTLIGRALPSETATKTGNQIGNAVAGGITPIIDKVTGEIRQGVDSLTGSIRNVVGTWTGLGGFNPSAPYENLISTVYEQSGTVINVYKNGDQTIISASGTQLIKGSETLGLRSFYNSIPGQNTDSTGAALGAGYGSMWTDGSGNPILNGANDYVLSGGDLSYLSSVDYGFEQSSYLVSNIDDDANIDLALDDWSW